MSVVQPDPGALSGPEEVVELRYEIDPGVVVPGDVALESEYAFVTEGPVPGEEYGELTSRHEAMAQRIALIHGGEIHAEGSEFLSPEAEAYRVRIAEEVTWATGGRR